MSDSFTARVPVPTFTKTADGNIYMSRGDQPVKLSLIHISEPTRPY